LIRAAAVPLAESEGLLAAMRYLGQDAVSAFLVGALFAWAMHSSVAVVLLIFAFVAQGLLSLSAAVPIVLGANLGGAFIAYALTMKMPYKVRRIVTANLILRGGGAAVLVLVLALLDYPVSWLGSTDAVRIVNLHLVFNIALAIVALAMLGGIERIIEATFPERRDHGALLGISSALEEAALERPAQALACSSREIFAMGQRIETMLRSIDTLYTTWDEPLAKAIEEKDREIRKMHFDLKLYLARLHRNPLGDEESREAMDHATVAANLEAASTVIAQTMVTLARRLQRGNKAFSTKGREEISDFHDRVLTNVQLSLNVMMTQNPDAARELVVAKDEVRDIEQQLQRHHLGRLREGLTESIETSNIHQETLRALKQVNTTFSITAYPILSRSGDLLESRLASEQIRVT
jgi:phosphate:Na+ symporter